MKTFSLYLISTICLDILYNNIFSNHPLILHLCDFWLNIIKNIPFTCMSRRHQVLCYMLDEHSKTKVPLSIKCIVFLLGQDFQGLNDFLSANGPEREQFLPVHFIKYIFSVLCQTKRFKPSTVSPSKIFLKADVYVYVRVGICEGRCLRGQKGASNSVQLELETELPKVHAGN